jgi:hypothetical protein
MAARYDHLLPDYSAAELAAERWRLVRVEGVLFTEYGVSDLGRIRNLKTGRLLKMLWCHAVRGEASVYWRVCLSRGPKGRRGEKGRRVRKAFLVHRLVAEAFVDGKTAAENIVHHRDNVTFNPRAVNLEWTTPSGNLNYYYADKRAREQEDAYHDSLRESVEASGDSAAGLDSVPILPDGYPDEPLPDDPCPF